MDISAIPSSDAVQDVKREHRHTIPESRRASESYNAHLSRYPASSLTAGSMAGNDDNDLSQVPRRFLRQILGINPFRTSYWSLFRPIDDWPSQCVLFLAIICAVVAGIPLPIIGVIFSKIIDSFPPPEDKLIKNIGELLGVAVTYFIVTWTWSVCWGIVGERISKRLREALVEKAMGMDMAFYDVGNLDITAVLTTSTQTIQMGTSEKVGLFIQSISYFVAAFVVGFILNATLTGILFAAVIPTMIIVVVTGTTIVSVNSKRATDLLENATSVAESAIRSVQVVQAFGAIQLLSDEHYRRLAKALRKGVIKSVSSAIMLGFVYFTCYAANALAFYEGSSISMHGAGTIYAVVFLILDASFVVGQFGPFIQTFAQAASAGSKVFEILDRVDPRINVYSKEGVVCQHSTFDKDIVLRDVSFRYPARVTTRVLHAVNLTFKPFTTTGIVGLSGSGKSTIASLLLRFYDPFSGHVIFGERDLTALNVTSLRAHMSLVDQNPVLFSGTILDNIRHGIVNVEELAQDEILQRCKDAAAKANADFISDLPKGIYTQIGMSGGTSLSGGQRQRLCLARAIVRRPKVMILDEPTSALDTTSESLILESLRKVSRSGCTVIMIAHRLATIKDSDNIIVMGNGEVLEQGTHEQLLDHDGPYKGLVEAQAMGDAKPNDDVSSCLSQTSDSTQSTTISKLDIPPSSNDDLVQNSPQKPMLPLLEILRRCFALTKPERFLSIIGLCASTLSGAIVIGESIIFGHLVSILNAENLDPLDFRSAVNFLCLMFFVVSLVALVANSTSGSCFGLVSESLILRVRDISLRTILKQDLAWFSTPGHSSHELMTLINMDTGRLSGLSGVIIGTVFSVTTSVFGGIIVAHVVAWKMAIVLLSAVPVMILAGFFRLRVLAKSEERHETAYSSAAALASEACQSLRTVAAFGREHDVLREYKAVVQEPYRQSFKSNVAGNFTLAFSLAITYFVYSLAYWWGSQQVRDGDYTDQDFFIVLPALLFSAQASGQMFSLAPEVTRARSAASSIFRLHDQTPSILQEQDSSARGGLLGKLKSLSSFQHEHDSHFSHDESTTQRYKGHVRLQDVSLAYPSRPGHLILRDVTLTIQPGQLVGIVGPSGAGKSSLISLLERFYDVQSGTVKIDNQDIRERLVSDHRDRLSLVSQEPDLFSGSIAFNIRMGAKAGQTISQDDVEKVCSQVGVHDFIMSLPEGYQTDCGYNGSKLSGGQKQRIAIARALLRDPEILLLDEATASLDSQSEKQVHSAVLAAAQNRTTIVVAHRLSTIQHADNIFVLDQGRIAEQGKHEDLVAQQGIYASMVQAQNLAR